MIRLNIFRMSIIALLFVFISCAGPAGKLADKYEDGLDILWKVKTAQDLEKQRQNLENLIKDIQSIKKSASSRDAALKLHRQENSPDSQVGKIRKELLITVQNAFVKFNNNENHQKLLKKLYQAVRY